MNFKNTTGLMIAVIPSLILAHFVYAGIYTNQADIKVVNAPTSDGVLKFVFEPKGGTPQAIYVEVGKRWSEKTVAREIERVFNQEVGANCKVSWNSKRKVEITKRHRKTRFYLGFVESTATGVTVRIDYD